MSHTFAFCCSVTSKHIYICLYIHLCLQEHPLCIAKGPKTEHQSDKMPSNRTRAWYHTFLASNMYLLNSRKYRAKRFTSSPAKLWCNLVSALTLLQGSSPDWLAASYPGKPPRQTTACRLGRPAGRGDAPQPGWLLHTSGWYEHKRDGIRLELLLWSPYNNNKIVIKDFHSVDLKALGAALISLATPLWGRYYHLCSAKQ